MHQRLLGFRSQAGASFYKNSCEKAHFVKGGSSQGPSFLYSTPSKIESGIFAYYTLIHCDVENQDRKGVKYMPNWVASHAIFEGPMETLKKIYGRCDAAGGFSFKTFIPVPEALYATKSPCDVQAAAFVWSKDHPLDSVPSVKIMQAFDSLVGWTEEIERGKKYYEELKNDENYSTATQFVEEGRRLIENVNKYGYPTWYEWCCVNWGTKWDVSEEDVTFDAPSPVGDSGAGKTDLYINTAWSCPLPVFETISKQYPDITITCDFADENIGNNCGSFTTTNGITAFVDRTGDIVFACGIWDEDPDEYITEQEEDEDDDLPI